MKIEFSRFPKTLHTIALIVALSLAQLHAAPIPGLFNTGLDNTGAPLADNRVDPHYQIIVNPDGGLDRRSPAVRAAPAVRVRYAGRSAKIEYAWPL